MKKAIVIGSGPAGISAALYLKRSNIDVTVISKGIGALEKAEKIENFYGTEALSGTELYERGIESAKKLGIEFIKEQAVSIDFDENFKPVIETDKNSYKADAVLLAMGVSRKSQNIKGLKEFEGKGVSYCAVCDAFFYRNKPAAVIGSGEYALHEALTLANSCSEVTILTNGEALQTRLPDNISVSDKIITELSGDDKLQSVKFEDGSQLNM